MFLPPAEQEAALARVAAAADALLERSASVEGAAGDALAVVAARVWAAQRVPRSTGCCAGRRATASLPSWTVTTTSAGSCCGGWPRWTRCRTARSRSPRPPTAPSPARSRRSACGRCDRPPRPRSGPGRRCATTPTCRTTRRSPSPGASGWRPTPSWCARTSRRSVTWSSRCRRGWVTTRCPGSCTAIHPTRLVDDATAAASAALLERDDLTPRSAASARGCRPRAA